MYGSISSVRQCCGAVADFFLVSWSRFLEELKRKLRKASFLYEARVQFNL